MATSTKSSSMRKAQVPVSCYFCKGQYIKWKCEDCNVRMCNSCKVTVHKGLTSTHHHDVVSIQDIGKSKPGSQEVTSVAISSVFNSYTTSLPAVSTLLCSDDDLLIFKDADKRSAKHQVIRGKFVNSSIQILQKVKRKIYDIALNKDGDILFIDYDTNKIHSLSPVGEVKTLLDIYPMTPLAIHVNKDNEVIVGMREQGRPFPVQDFSVRQVILFGSDYQRKVTLEFDKEGNKLFSYVHRIRTDSKNVVCVIDIFDNDSNGRIVAVDRNGRLQFTYAGPNDFGKFRPEAITITPRDNIVVVDYTNDTLHVINSKGDLLGLQFIFQDLGIYGPRSLCFDSEGYLLIGGTKGNHEKYGKIHVVKLADSLI